MIAMRSAPSLRCDNSGMQPDAMVVRSGRVIVASVPPLSGAIAPTAKSRLNLTGQLHLLKHVVHAAVTAPMSPSQASKGVGGGRQIVHENASAVADQETAAPAAQPPAKKSKLKDKKAGRKSAAGAEPPTLAACTAFRLAVVRLSAAVLQCSRKTTTWASHLWCFRSTVRG